MILISNSPPFLLRTNPPNPFFSPSFIYLNPPCSSSKSPARFHALKTESEGDNKVITPLDLHRKPTISNHQDSNSDESGKRDDDWVDWEDQILEDTVPLVGFVRMLLHSGKYGRGDRLSPEHEKTILERLLPYHPEAEKKIGCGIDFIKVDHHPEFEDSRCLFIVRKDGEYVDFSYWKCIKGLIKTNYPLYADSFILKHFRRRSGRSNV